MQPPPPPPPQPSLVDTLSPPLSAATTILLNNNPDSVESSPRCRTVVDQPWPDQEPLLPHVPGAKLRLMISYGGHIMPRPHDKSLSYVGGDTRMVAVERHTSLKDLCSRLSYTLLHGRPFTLKYQLPNEELDNLITVTNDEDLDNMIEEYDRLSSKPSSSSPSRLRVFLFFCKPDTALSMGSLIDDAKSETWFVDALNNSGILSRVVSDSAAVDECLVNLDDGDPVPSAASSNDLNGNGGGAAAIAAVGDGNDKQGNNDNNKHLGDVHSIPGSPVVVENNSSCYGSSSSSSSMATLPPIKVRVDENGGSRLQLVMEEQFAQMTFGTAGGGGVVKQDDACPISSSSAAMHATIPAPVTMIVIPSASDSVSRVVSDEERSLLDHQVAPGNGGFRKPPLPLQLVQPRSFSGHFGLPSPDSVASDSSIQSGNSYSKAVYYQEQVQQANSHVDNNSNAPPLSNLKSEQKISDQSLGLQREQVQDSAYTLPQQMDQSQQLHHHHQQQQFVYIHHNPTPTGQVPMSPYYTVYAPPIASSSHHHHHHQYPVYVMPGAPTQQYNMAMQSNINNISDPNNNVVVASARPLIPQSAAAAAYKDASPPIYPTKLVTPTTLPSDVAPNVYKAPVAASSPAFVQIPTPNQLQQQYVGMTRHSIHLPTQPNATASSASTNYGYEYGGPAQQDQVYYAQHQSMTPAALSDASIQFPLDNIQQPTRTTTQQI